MTTLGLGLMLLVGCDLGGELSHAVDQVGLADDRVPPVNRLGLVPGQLHRDEARHPGAGGKSPSLALITSPNFIRLN